MPVTEIKRQGGAKAVELEGMVLETHSTDYRIMSDVWCNATRVTFWDEETQSVKHKTCPHDSMAATRYDIDIDADSEVREKAAAWRKCRDWFEGQIDKMERHLREYDEISQHDVVKVFKGRKVPVGTLAIVEKIGVSDYGAYAHLKVVNEDGSVFIDPKTACPVLYRYVSIGNLEVHLKGRKLQCGCGKATAGFFKKIVRAKSEEDRQFETAMLFDYLSEQGSLLPAILTPWLKSKGRI